MVEGKEIVEDTQGLVRKDLLLDTDKDKLKSILKDIPDLEEES